MRAPSRWDRVATLPAALGLAAAGLVAAFAVKYQCVLHGWVDDYQYTHLCYNEIQALFGPRGIADGLLPYRDTAFEYPVLTGMFMDLAGRVLRGLVALGLVGVNDSSGYLVVSALLLAPFSLAVTLLLRPRVTAGRLALWSVGLPTVLYTFHNWDVLAVWGAAWGLAAWERDRPGRAGGALAAGASAKLFPAFLAPGMVLERWSRRDFRSGWRLIAGFVAVYLVLNVPWILISAGDPELAAARFPGVELRESGNGWLNVWLFHAGRYPDYWTIWYWLGDRAPALHTDPWFGESFTGLVGWASFAAFAALTGTVLWWGWRRRREPGGFPVTATGLGIVAAFLITSKVYSPQYALWLVPLLALLDVRLRYVLLYFASELAVLVAGFRWFTVFDRPDSVWERLLEGAVWVRAAVLVLLLWQSRNARRRRPAADPASVAG